MADRRLRLGWRRRGCHGRRSGRHEIIQRKSDDFDGILTGYFTIPTIPSVTKFCRDGMLGENCRKRVSRFLIDHRPLRKLLERSKSLTSDLQSEMTAALKTALRGSQKKARTALEVEGVDSPYWQTARASSTFGPWVVGPDTETDVVACIEARIARLRDGFLQAGGWRGVVHGPKENYDCLTDHDIH